MLWYCLPGDSKYSCPTRSTCLPTDTTRLSTRITRLFTRSTRLPTRSTRLSTRITRLSTRSIFSTIVGLLLLISDIYVSIFNCHDFFIQIYCSN